MFRYLPLSQQVFRHHDYNFIQKENIKPNLKDFPICQMTRAWNCSNILIKSEAEIAVFKETFISQCMNKYEDECVKPNCYVCNRI